MSPLTVTLQIAYAENEQQFLLQAVEAAVRTYRSLNRKPGDAFGEVSSTSTAQGELPSQLGLAS